MKFADRLVGKGLDTWVIIRLIMYNLAWMVVLVVPMAVLIATLMAFGKMSQDNEFTIMKSAGLSLYKIAAAPFLAAIVVGYLLIRFNNEVLPDANHKAKNLSQDISQKKPTLTLEPNVFMQDINNYAILSREIDPKNGNLKGLTIYDYTNPNKINIITALHGKIYFSSDKSKLLMDLDTGQIHESNPSNSGIYRKLVYAKHRIALPAEQFAFQQSADSYRGDRELSAQNMMLRVDSLKYLKDYFYPALLNESFKYFYGDSTSIPTSQINGLKRDMLISRAIDRVKLVKNAIGAVSLREEFVIKQIDAYMVEVYKKYALPVACIIFVLLGAPLGVMTRRGGFGMAASISLFFFLVYWAFLIGGEKLADRGLVSPFVGMWSANFVMGCLGMFLMYKSVRDNLTIDFSFLIRLIPKKWRHIVASETVENENS